MQLSSNQVNPQNNIKPRANQQSSNSSMYCRYYNNCTDCPGRHRRAHCNTIPGRGFRI